MQDIRDVLRSFETRDLCGSSHASRAWYCVMAVSSMAPAWDGQGAPMSCWRSAPCANGSVCQSRSVTKGMIGCASARSVRNVYTKTCTATTILTLFEIKFPLSHLLFTFECFPPSQCSCEV